MSESTALVPYDENQTSLDKFMRASGKLEGERDIPQLRKLFMSRDERKGVPLTPKEQELVETPFFEAFKVQNDEDEYSNDIGQPLNLYEQVRLEETDRMLDKARTHYNVYEKLGAMEDRGMIHNIPEYYRRDLYYLDGMVQTKTKTFEAYSFKSDERRYGKVLRVLTDATREDLHYLAQSWQKSIINRRVNLADAGKNITVGGVMYPTKLIRRFRRGSDVSAFQLPRKTRNEDGTEKPPLLCIEVYGGTLIVQGMWRPYYKTHADGTPAAA